MDLVTKNRELQLQSLEKCTEMTNLTYFWNASLECPRVLDQSCLYRYAGRSLTIIRHHFRDVVITTSLLLSHARVRRLTVYNGNSSQI